MEFTPVYHRTIGHCTMLLARRDITQEDTDAIVNAANPSLMGGGGVDGAIHRAGGPEILAECMRISAAQGGCRVGEAVITTAGHLKARYVIHTVGPVWRGGGQNEEVLLASAYRNSLKLATRNGIRTIAFPSISTGAYGYPIDRAAHTAIATVREVLQETGSPQEVRFIVFSDSDLGAYTRAFDEMCSNNK